MKRLIISRPALAVILAFTGILVGCATLIGIHDPSAGYDAGADGADAGTDGADAGADGADAGADDSSVAADGADAADPDLWAAPTPTMTVYIADATGDGKADLIGVEPNAVIVWPSNGTSFVPESTPWLAQTLAGEYGVFFADMTGDGTADAIVADAVVSVGTSTGSGFNPLTPWTSAAFGGDLLTAFSDVNGDHKADGLGLGVQAIYVALSTGTGFLTGTDWTTGDFYGNCGGSEAFADVRGVGYSDAIAMRFENGIGVIPSTKGSFNNSLYALWTRGQPYCGTKGDYFADVNGDGKADAIAVSTTGIEVLLSNGTSFQAASSGLYWTKSSFYGAFATLFADVNGDKLADAIAVDDGSVRVWLSNGSAFVSALP